MTSPTTHIHHDPAAALAPASPAWLRWSAAWTRQARILTGRDDLSVTVAPGAGRGAPACHIPTLATIEVDAALIGDPAVADPRRPGHKKAVPAAYGALVHEAAHAAHSRWQPPPGTPPVIATVAAMLEESRAELRQRQRRARDRQWLRQAVRAIVAASDLPTDTLWDAAAAAGLLLARVDAGVLTHTDTRTLRRTLTSNLGRPLLRQLRTIWRAVHTVHDTDTQAMLGLAKAWCNELEIDPDLDPQVPDTAAVAPPGRHIPAAVAAVVAAIDPTTPPAPAPAPPPAVPGGTRSPGTGQDVPVDPTSRSPTSSERHAAARLAEALRRARTREPVPTRQAAPAPPGRLQVRAAIAAQAQAATGAAVTAQPWQRTVHRPVPDPQLAVAVLVDTSGSMHRFADPLSSAAWILAHAAQRTGAVCTTITFADHATVLIPPRQRPGQVRQIRTGNGSAGFPPAVATAETLVGLSTPGVVRLLVVVSDGEFFEQTQPAQQSITRLHHTGATILWLAPAGNPRNHTYTHTTTITVDDPTSCIDLIGRAATRALTHD